MTSAEEMRRTVSFSTIEAIKESKKRSLVKLAELTGHFHSSMRNRRRRVMEFMKGSWECIRLSQRSLSSQPLEFGGQRLSSSRRKVKVASLTEKQRLIKPRVRKSSSAIGPGLNLMRVRRSLANSSWRAGLLLA